jgi:prepilin-type processing-associated H-X9-DG protein
MGTCRSFTGGTFDGPAYMVDTPALGNIVTLATVTDGTSNTAIFSEYIKGKGASSGISPGLNAVFKSTISFSTSPPSPALSGSWGQTMQTVASTCTRGGGAVYDLKGYNWMDGWSGGGGPYTHLRTPNVIACLFSNDGTVPLEDRSLVGPSSNHSGGVNVGFLDGSIHFIKDSVNPQSWAALGTKQGGEVIDAASY